MCCCCCCCWMAKVVGWVCLWLTLQYFLSNTAPFAQHRSIALCIGTMTAVSESKHPWLSRKWYRTQFLEHYRNQKSLHGRHDFRRPIEEKSIVTPCYLWQCIHRQCLKRNSNRYRSQDPFAADEPLFVWFRSEYHGLYTYHRFPFPSI